MKLGEERGREEKSVIKGVTEGHTEGGCLTHHARKIVIRHHTDFILKTLRNSVNFKSRGMTQSDLYTENIHNGWMMEKALCPLSRDGENRLWLLRFQVRVADSLDQTAGGENYEHSSNA